MDCEMKNILLPVLYYVALGLTKKSLSNYLSAINSKDFNLVFKNPVGTSNLKLFTCQFVYKIFSLLLYIFFIPMGEKSHVACPDYQVLNGSILEYLS
jgi:hypothetical protein